MLGFIIGFCVSVLHSFTCQGLLNSLFNVSLNILYIYIFYRRKSTCLEMLILPLKFTLFKDQSVLDPQPSYFYLRE